ncbi:MAG: Crp/Fnr family transcriptional regulator [Bacteroidota bacterium]
MKDEVAQNSLINCVNKSHKLSSTAQRALFERLSRDEIEKEAHLLEEGQVCHKLYFIESGCVRSYYHLDGKEITHWFGFENDFVTSFLSFIDRSPSREFIQVVENLAAWTITRVDLYKLYDEFPEIERLGRILCEQYYHRLEERYVSGQFKTAAQRYEGLLESHKHILQRIPLGQIASYLGISQETLSRIRAKSV